MLGSPGCAGRWRIAPRDSGRAVGRGIGELLRLLHALHETGEADAAYREDAGNGRAGGDQLDDLTAILADGLAAPARIRQAHRRATALGCCGKRPRLLGQALGCCGPPGEGVHPNQGVADCWNLARIEFQPGVRGLDDRWVIGIRQGS